MIEHPELSETEWELVAELLERERGDLAVEIRHTRTSTVREELRQRAEVVKSLLHRFRHPEPV